MVGGRPGKCFAPYSATPSLINVDGVEHGSLVKISPGAKVFITDVNTEALPEPERPCRRGVRRIPSVSDDYLQSAPNVSVAELLE
jgi:hypothetical protein